MSYLAALLPLSAALAVFGGSGQDAPAVNDWDYAEDVGQNLAIASVEYAGGVSLIVQCLDGDFKVGIGGLPVSASSPVRLERRRADGRVEDTYWRPAGGTLITSDSWRYGRWFRAGGPLSLTGDPEGAPPVRLELTLPSRSDNVDRVLTACGGPLESPFDEALDVGGLLTEGPRIEMPSSALQRHDLISVYVDCYIANGRLASCRSDRQRPVDARAGAAVAREANGTRIGLSDVAAAEGRTVEVVITGTRIRR
jgi:hypothetical protein